MNMHSHSEARFGGVAAWHSRAGTLAVEGQLNTMQQKMQSRGLERQPLETLGLDKHSLVWRLDEAAVTQKQDLAGARWGYEAHKRASSCSATNHGCLHRREHQMEDHNELGTDLTGLWD